MNKIIRFSLGAVVVLLAMYACNISGGNEQEKAANFSGDGPAISHTIQVANGSTVFNTVGQTINFNYNRLEHGKCGSPRTGHSCT